MKVINTNVIKLRLYYLDQIWTEEQFSERLASLGFAYLPDTTSDRFARNYLRTLSQTVPE